jgi:hypothetical protein
MIEPARSEPRLWVKRLVLQSEPGVLLREISLRPGLNVVWSPDPGDPGGRPATSALGHGAGKTLFCRMLRYCLGESRFAPEGQRDDIIGAFPEGLVGAEVVVDGRTWAVSRSIGYRRRHVAVPDADLDAVMRGEGPSTGVAPFVHALGDQLVTEPIASLVPDRRADGVVAAHPSEHAWLTALAWLARDQECRFGDVLDWRAAASDSDSPVRAFARADTLLALRALLGALEPKEREVRTQIGDLEKVLEAVNADARHWAWEADRVRTELVRTLGLRDDELPPGRLAVEVLRRAARERVAQVRGVAANDGGGDGLPALREQLDAAMERRGDLAAQLEGFRVKRPLKEADLARRKGEAEIAGARLSDARDPVCELCEVPIDRVLLEGCKLSHEKVNVDALRDRQRDAVDRHSALKHEIDNDDIDERTCARALTGARATVRAIRERIRPLEVIRDAESEAWARTRRAVDEVDRFERALVEQEQAGHRAADLHQHVTAQRESVAELRGAQSDVFQRLSGRFEEIVRRLASAEADGRVRLTGRGLELEITMGGNRSTAAIESLKVIAFDLAALILAIEGRVHVPAFLVHDSPREADLGRASYDQIFAIARALETFGPKPAFQYIVTTTSSPPEDVRPDAGLVLTLHGAPASARLLCRDL